MAVLGRQNTWAILFEQVLKGNPGPESCLSKIAEAPADLLHLIRAQCHKPFSSCHWINIEAMERKCQPGYSFSIKKVVADVMVNYTIDVTLVTDIMV